MWPPSQPGALSYLCACLAVFSEYGSSAEGESDVSASLLQGQSLRLLQLLELETLHRQFHSSSLSLVQRREINDGMLDSKLTSILDSVPLYLRNRNAAYGRSRRKKKPRRTRTKKRRMHKVGSGLNRAASVLNAYLSGRKKKAPLASRRRQRFRKRDPHAMESVHINYGEIHKDVTRFVNELAGRYVSGTSSAMQNVKAIPDILHPNDPAFRNNEADKVIKRCTFFLQVMDVLLDTVPAVVKPEYADWLDGQTRKLKMWKTLVNMSLVSLSFNSNVGNVDSASGGIGGVNFGVDSDMDINVRIKIQQLLHALKAISQTTQSR